MSPSILKSSQSLVCIIIPAHNRKRYTLKCLAGLNASDDLADFSVTVIDDGSADGTSEAIRQGYPQVRVLYGDGNLWWTGAIKIGMQDAITRGFTLIIWLNDDCLVGRNTISALVSFARKNNRSIVGATGYESDCPSKISFGGKVKVGKKYQLLEPSDQKVHECDLLSGNLVCMPTAVVRRIGYPDTDKTPHYGGDSLFLIRARQAGYSLFVDNRWPATNISTAEKSSTNPSDWLTGNISTVEITSLIFNRHSLMSWRVWWTLYTEDYQYCGVILFVLKFFRLAALLACITVLRLLPVRARKKISLVKREIFAS